MYGILELRLSYMHKSTDSGYVPNKQFFDNKIGWNRSGFCNNFPKNIILIKHRLVFSRLFIIISLFFFLLQKLRPHYLPCQSYHKLHYPCSALDSDDGVHQNNCKGQLEIDPFSSITCFHVLAQSQITSSCFSFLFVVYFSR